MRLCDVDPESYLEAKAAAEELDAAQVGSPAERRFTNQFTDMPPVTARTMRTAAQAPARPHQPVWPTAMVREVPQTCAPATLLARHAVMHRAAPTDGAVTSRYSIPVQVDLCGCIYRPDGGLLRYCAGTTPIHLHEEGPR